MKKQNSRYRGSSTVDYKTLGTISIEQFAQAIWEDLKALKDIYGVSYVTASKLVVAPTNEYGDPVVIRHPDGHVVKRCDTHYYRPACMDYQL